ncbi:hypothetical protein AQ505_20465 [Pedobacter sp. PACM 27299]|uniref:hypothetical protein n=1 Tax=Pedobacter sp. PACM 27299 TaxID=1727164 RepID=UPI000705D9BF|nr:hypothetical protein [Pedobacter sp. PACM 27299]ALL07653.1 hypothetical protein AQ505_20465 [Pedobacter sp. PACM 27299]
MTDKRSKIKKLQQRVKVLEGMLLEEVLKNDLLCQKSNALISLFMVPRGKIKSVISLQEIL